MMDRHIKGLSIAHLNIRGLLNKIDQIRYLLVKHKFSILHLSETFLTSKIVTELVSIPGYNIVRRDRVGRLGGGLVTFIESSLPYKPISDLNSILSETMTIKISPGHCKPFLTTAIYRPPNSPALWIDNFEKLISSARLLSDDLIILGDFNINLETPQRKWSNSYQQLGLEQVIQHPTRVQQRSCSLIDHIYVSKPYHLTQSGTLEIGISDHYLTFASRKLGLSHNSRQPTKLHFMDWKNFSPTAFQADLNYAEWHSIYLCRTAEAMLSMFLTKLKEIVSNHLRRKSKHIKSISLPPWLDKEVQSSMKLRDYLKRKQNWAAYKTQRNYTNNLIKRKKKQHVTNLISDGNQKQTKKLWNTLRNSPSSTVTPRYLGHNLPQTDTDIANALNSHFSNVSSLSSSRTPATPDLSVPSHYLDKIPSIDIHQFILYFKDIGSNKATGSDGLSVKILRLALPFIVPILCDIINRAISEGCFPSQWKEAVITPLHKGGDKENLSNYRPISVLPILSKIFERHIHKTLSTYLFSHNMISDSQSGFRSKHSCSTAMHHLYSQWIDAQKTKHSLVLLFLDLRKAFDMVNHNLLIHKLAALGISGPLFSLLCSYLTGRTQCVKIHNSVSSTVSVSCGVPQGSILAPTLFLVFINDLLTLPLNSKVHGYADDTTFYLSNSSPSLLQDLVSSDIALIEKWCESNMMVLNETKSHYLVVNQQNYPFSFSVNNTVLQKQPTTKLLGFVINSTLTWNDHIDTISKKVSANLRLFYNIRHLIDFSTSKLFYYNYIHPYLTYGIHLYFPMSPNSQTKYLFGLQKRALRLICKPYQSQLIKKTLSSSFITHKTEILSLPSLSTYFTCISAHNIKNKQCPSYLTASFPTSSSCKSTRYQHKIPSSQHYNRLNQQLINTFNALPITLRCSTYSTFKTKLKSFLFTHIT